MRMLQGCLVLSLLCAAGTPALAQCPHFPLVRPDSVVWRPAPPNLPAGARIASLSGDPLAQGRPYVYRMLLPDGYRVPPHAYPVDTHVTVLAGTLLLGFGEQSDESSLADLPAGSYVLLPGDDPLYLRARGRTILQVHGTGPHVIGYVNPADDPGRTSRRN